MKQTLPLCAILLPFLAACSPEPIVVVQAPDLDPALLAELDVPAPQGETVGDVRRFHLAVGEALGVCLADRAAVRAVWEG